MRSNTKLWPTALYIHIPFCRSMCHYCDFAKTARYREDQTKLYFEALKSQYQAWLEHLSSKGVQPSWTSVNFGGGTPSLFCNQVCDFLEHISPEISSNAEISLEANPLDVISYPQVEQLAKRGFNRVSLGIQSFSDRGLQVLTRDHSEAEARKALENCLQVLPNVGIDLIYCWPTSSRKEWQTDLSVCSEYPVQHISCYNMTYAEKTPFGRMAKRNKIAIHKPEQEATYYEDAVEFLRLQGFDHEEVSNWSKPGFNCRHNQNYWQMKPYIAIGTGAHGFLQLEQNELDTGLRYAYCSKLKSFSQYSEQQILSNPSISWEERSASDWLLEYLGSGLRTAEGLYIEQITNKGFEFLANPQILEAIKNQQVKFNQGRLKLSPTEWFRETAWAVELSNCFSAIDSAPQQTQ